MRRIYESAEITSHFLCTNLCAGGSDGGEGIYKLQRYIE
jgi:hypothetical protein